MAILINLVTIFATLVNLPNIAIVFITHNPYESTVNYINPYNPSSNHVYPNKSDNNHNYLK